MAIRVALNHKTNYRFDRLVKLSPHVIRLRPAAHTRTPIEAYSLAISPKNHFINWQQDPFGNYLARVVFPEKSRHLSIEVDMVAELTVINPFDFFVEESAKEFPFHYESQLHKELTPYLEILEKGPRLRGWLSKTDKNKKSIVDFLVALNQRLEQDIEYSIRMDPGVQSCETTLEKAVGSCRDSAWLLVQILRNLGLAARFVSGYLIQLKPDIKPLEGPSGAARDFTDLHAWAEVYIPGAGWIGLDPTSGLAAGEGHIPLSCTPHPVSAAPITGATDECEVQFDFSNTVQRIHEDPRVTKPYTDSDWHEINVLGEMIDAEIESGDIRLTLGGEPTFVSIDEMDTPEWNYAAFGEQKRELAEKLLQRLWNRFAPGGLLHFGQGKWYPGEALPRWALSCFWRKDGEPLWKNPELIAKSGVAYDCGHEEANRYGKELALNLGLAPERFLTAYEDTLYYLWLESRQPLNINPKGADLKEVEEKKRLARLLSAEIRKPAGFVLPLRRRRAQGKWQSCDWKFRRGRLYLTPGDSPIGLRLPLDSLQREPDKEHEIDHQQSLFENLAPLKKTDGGKFQTGNSDIQNIDANSNAQGSTSIDSKQPFITALCIEPRHGTLHVFLPPQSHLEDFLNLVTAIEATSEKLKIPVRLEGYEPPKDWRMEKFAVTPDPGVVEVNIHPARTWGELVSTTEILYQEARQSRLSTEKFMLDGRHCGTGGGNHVTIGAEKPADSPILRRPDLLRSLVTYWQHHPGLSFLFSGQFIGPTSQAPRVDEARNESLYELEIAFQQMPDGEIERPWLVDRLLRNLLVDITGNTHRSEFCIDKLYAPHSATGRLGIVEFRGFEMPPHARLSLVQMLLLRTLIAKFWRRPYKHNLVRWGTALHDRFMLPYYVWNDIQEVIRDINRDGYPFKTRWLNPFLEFRFPHIGTVMIGGIQLELSTAIEPWHVLGEEVSNTGTARFVDSSLERLQIKAIGLPDARFVVTCNQRRVPLKNTGTQGEYVAGVRYRAWQPPSALHPTIGIHSPLVFDIIDTWNARSIGGCTYHVAHPGGRNYENYPVNAYEAETRRISRFFSFGHTPGPIQAQSELLSTDDFSARKNRAGPTELLQEEINQEYPYTLDLRRQVE